jgi:DNA-binding NarL/FixJ family response regulator
VKTERVFAVDDDESYLELLELVLRSHCGVPEVRTFARGDAAVAALRGLPPARQPELLVLDFHMPGLDGLGVLRALGEAGVRLPVLVLSNAGGPQDRAACLAAGARAFLAKPARVEDLAATLRAELAGMAAEVMAPTVRIVLADDHELVRSGISALLSLLPGVAVVGEARDGVALVRLLEQVGADIVMSDIGMPGMDGLEAIARIQQAHPAVRTIVLSMDDSADAARSAFAAGASGYIVKQAATAELETAIHAVLAGRRYVSPALAPQLLLPAADSPQAQLTERQVEILTCIARGQSSRTIGAQLGLSSKTVDAHRARIMDRLGIFDIAGLTRYAVRHRLVR